VLPVRKHIILLFVLLLGQSAMSSSSENEKYQASLKKWINDRVSHYSIRVIYSAFSPLSGTWELEVKEGRVVFFTFNGVYEKRYSKFAEKFTMEALYKTAGDSVMQDQKSPMVVNAEYDLKTGYIESIRRISNPEYSGRKMRDAGYLIQVIDLKPL